MAQKYKLQVLVSEELKEKLEKYCNLTGVSMSALCNVFIANGIMGYDAGMDMIAEMKKKFLEMDK